MRKALIAALVVVFVLSLAGIAPAADPTVIQDGTWMWEGEQLPAGASAWSYRDIHDGAAKNEGAYNAFTGSVSFTTSVDDGAFGTVDTAYTNEGYVDSPHGGYDTTTSKCKVCHAVHRAEGAYYLLRVDSQDDACSYCHIGGSAHSSKVVYDLNPAGLDTTNGHTIGAQTEIPDSSTYQYAQVVTLEGTDADGLPISEAINVRAYDPAKNSMYRFGRHHGQSDEGTGRSGYSKIGPLALRCMNCHQVHNAADETWRPLAWVATGWSGSGPVQDLTAFDQDGYKLLKRYPSASTTGAINTYGYYDVGQNIKVIEGNAVPEGHSGPWGLEEANFSQTESAGFTYNQNDETASAPLWIAQDIHEPELASYPTPGSGYYRYPYFNSPYALSYWCADCHNLNIGGWEPLADVELGFKAHNERTHPSPYYGAYEGPGQCYSCHRNDLSPKMGETTAGGSGRSTLWAGRGSCSQCHFGTADYYVEMDTGTDLGLDFPHSGRTTDIKLLGSYSSGITGDGTTTGATTVVNTTIGSGNLDAVCLRCHPGVGVHQ